MKVRKRFTATLERLSLILIAKAMFAVLRFFCQGLGHSFLIRCIIALKFSKVLIFTFPTFSGDVPFYLTLSSLGI